jgi:hypothetical protein
MQVKLDETNWAELKEVSDLRRFDRKAVNAATVTELDGDTRHLILRGSMDDDIADVVLKSVVTNWSLQLPLPAVETASLDKLTLEQDTALREAIQPHIDALKGSNAPVKGNETPTADSEK